MISSGFVFLSVKYFVYYPIHKTVYTCIYNGFNRILKITLEKYGDLDYTECGDLDYIECGDLDYIESFTTFRKIVFVLS